jgi:protein ImuB
MTRHRAGIAIVAPGTEATVLAALPLALLDELDAGLPIPRPASRKTARHQSPTGVLQRWGLKTLGEFVALPADEVMARLGAEGIDWQRLARGEDRRPLVPSVPEERFEQSLELEWPIEGLEPLSFVLGRLMEPLSAHLQLRDRGAAVLHVRLRLVTRHDGVRQVHERSLELPAPMREARTLRTLALLDLEAHPPAAAIDAVTVAVDPTPARVVQYSLLTRPLPTPEQLSTLMARLHALMGEARCGSPSAVDSWQPGAFGMRPFNPESGPGSGIGERGSRTLESDITRSPIPESRPPTPDPRSSTDPRSPLPDPRPPSTALRRFRMPIPARVQVDAGKPSRVTIDRRGFRGGAVATSAGPWRTSGAWWSGGAAPGARHLEPAGSQPGPRQPESRQPGAGTPKPVVWDRDEWDVSLDDGTTYRLFRERADNHWFVDGVVD